MTETIRFGLIGKQDLKIGAVTFDVTLPDGTVLTMDGITLGAFMKGVSGTVLIGNGATSEPTFSADPTVTSLTTGTIAATGAVDIDGLITAGSGGHAITTAAGYLSALKLAIASQAAGDLLYASSATVFARLGIGSTGQVLTVVGGVPAWSGALARNGINNFRLVKSGTDLTLEPINGNLVDINGTIYTYTTMPTLAGGLTATTLYYIYLYDDSGTATLESSATGYTVDTTGRANKTGDTTRRLMGMAYTDGSGNWQDTAANRHVASYANRPDTGGLAYFSADRSTTETDYAEIHTEIRVSFLVWTDSVVSLHANGEVAGDITDREINTAFGIDGITAEDAYTRSVSGSVVKQGFSLSLVKTGLDIGRHYVTLLGKTNAGTASYEGSATAGIRSSLTVRI